MSELLNRRKRQLTEGQLERQREAARLRMEIQERRARRVQLIQSLHCQD